MAERPPLLMFILLAIMVFPQWPAEGADAPSGVPSIEYENELPGSGNFMFNDTDRDGLFEIFYYGDGYVLGFDPPSYSRVLSIGGTYLGFSPLLKDLGMNGSIEIILFYNGVDHFNCSIISGKTFTELWRSPNINGKASSPRTGDIDCDGHLELIWSAIEQSFAQVYVFDAVSNKMEWVSQPILGFPTTYMDVSLKNLDSDPAQEIILGYKTHSLNVYDGATFKLQWELSSRQGFNFKTPTDFIQDFDDDGAIEFLIQYNETNATAENTYGFTLYSGESGAIEWNVTSDGDRFANTRFGDIDGDGGIELLETRVTGNYPGPYDITYEIFDFQEHRSLWKVGPIAQNDSFHTWMYANDLNRDGVAEIIISNTSYVNYTQDPPGSILSFPCNTYQVLDGRDFRVIWTSPTVGGNDQYVESVNLGQNETPVILLCGYSEENGTNTNGTISLYSAGDFRELWRSELYPGSVTAYLADYVNDPRKELLISVQSDNGEGKMIYLYDTFAYSLIWTSPKSIYSQFFWSLDGDDLTGNSLNELIFVNESSETIHVGNNTYSRAVSTILIYNDTTFKESWRSGKLPGEYHIQAVWDIDNDSNMEALFFVPREGYYDVNANIVVIEFPRQGHWPAGIDEAIPQVQIHSPLNGASVRGETMMSGNASDDRSITAVEVRIDAEPWQNATLLFAGSNFSCNWSRAWNVSGWQIGTHTITARSFDGHRQSPEASITISVKAPEPARAHTPTTTVSFFPDPLCLAGVMICISILAILIVRQLRK